MTEERNEAAADQGLQAQSPRKRWCSSCRMWTDHTQRAHDVQASSNDNAKGEG